jgi:pSer/pThr/pTyr-binding forkhead associated (FHA) protein
MRAQLIPLDGTAPVEIVKDLTLVGRKQECDLCLNHKSVSKMHCVIVKTDGLLLLRDLGSTNGTRVNGQRVRRAALLPNDNLAIAGFKFRIDLGPDSPPPAPSVQPMERTQPLDARELEELLAAKKGSSGVGHAPPKRPQTPIQTNPLPDEYPEEEGKKKKH